MRAVGIILAGGNNNRMKELTHKRAVAAMPILIVILEVIRNIGLFA